MTPLNSSTNAANNTNYSLSSFRSQTDNIINKKYKTNTDVKFNFSLDIIKEIFSYLSILKRIQLRILCKEIYSHSLVTANEEMQLFLNKMKHVSTTDKNILKYYNNKLDKILSSRSISYLTFNQKGTLLNQSELICISIKMLTYLKKIKLINCHFNDSILTVLSDCKQLQELTVKKCVIDVDSTDISSLTNLKKLSFLLYDEKDNYEYIPQLINKLSLLTNLTNFSLAINSDFDSVDMKGPLKIDFLSSIDKIVKLKLIIPSIDSYTPLLLHTQLKALTLQTLDLFQFNRLSITSLTRLKTLDANLNIFKITANCLPDNLQNITIETDYVWKNANFLSACRQVTTLTVKNIYEDIKINFYNFSFKNIKQLHLKGDFTYELFMPSLSSCTALTSLTLSSLFKEDPIKIKESNLYSLPTSLKKISMTSIITESFSFLSKFYHLEKIKLKNYKELTKTSICDYLPISIKEVNLVYSFNLNDISILSTYTNLRKLTVSKDFKNRKEDIISCLPTIELIFKN